VDRCEIGDGEIEVLGEAARLPAEEGEEDGAAVEVDAAASDGPAFEAEQTGVETGRLLGIGDGDDDSKEAGSGVGRHGVSCYRDGIGEEGNLAPASAYTVESRRRMAQPQQSLTGAQVMNVLGALSLILVFSLPVLVIVGKFATRWAELRTEQRSLGTSNRDLEQKVERLERAQAEAAQRIENLEAIVVSQTWNAVEKPGLSTAVHPHRLEGAGRQDLRAPAVEELNRQRAADLAGRLGG
jgi:hypothetical protein